MEKYRLMLTLFGEGGGASGGAAAGTGGEGGGTADGAQNQGGAQQTAPADKAAEFDRLIKGEYKAEYDQRFRQGLDRRFKETESLRQQVEGAKPLMELLAGKYGVSDAGDIAAIMKAAEADESYYEEEAAQKGLTVEQLRQFKKMERENAQFRAAEEQRLKAERTQQLQARWMQEAEAVKAMYPNFDFQQEAQNEGFAKLLAVGIDVKTAYQVLHQDEILSGAMQYTAQKVKEKTVNDIRARGMRPSEGGLGDHPAGEGRLDVAKLTKEQRADMARRALRGEKITL